MSNSKREDLKERIRNIRRQLQTGKIPADKTESLKNQIDRLEIELDKLPPATDMSHFELDVTRSQSIWPPTRRTNER